VLLLVIDPAFPVLFFTIVFMDPLCFTFTGLSGRFPSLSDLYEPTIVFLLTGPQSTNCVHPDAPMVFIDEPGLDSWREL
jgi:hypothetical protein